MTTSSTWYYTNDSKESVGPFSLRDLQKMRAAGMISWETLVIESDGTQWRPLKEVEPSHDVPSETAATEPPKFKEPSPSGTPVQTDASSNKRRVVFALLFLVMPYVAVPLFWIIGEYSRRTRIILTVVGAFLTLWIAMEVHNDDLPQNVGKRLGEAAALDAAKETGSVEAALASHLKLDLEKRGEISKNASERDLFTVAYDKAFRERFFSARQAAVKEAEEAAKQKAENEKDEKARKIGWDAGFLDGVAANRSGAIKPSDDIVNAKGRRFAGGLSGLGTDEHAEVVSGYERGFWDGWKSAR